MAVIKTLTGQTVVTVVCNIIYPDPPPIPPPDPQDDKFIQQIYKMASAWRVLAFFVVVFVVPVVLVALPLYARYTLFPARSLAVVQDDTLDLHKMSSSFWCQGQRTISNGTFDAHLLHRVPKVTTNRRRTTTVNSILNISEELPESRMVHLLKGSTVDFAVCSRWPGAQVVIVQGIENFKRCFYTDPDTDETEQRVKRKLPNRKNTKTAPTKVKRVLTISKSDIIPNAEEDASEYFDENDDELDIKNIRSRIEIKQDKSSSSKSYPDHKLKKSTDKYVNSERELITAPTISTTTINNITDIEQDVNNSSNLLRVLRSISSKHGPMITSAEKRKKDAEEARKFGLLHSVNDPRYVTAGNSSVSSSEEFMSHCKPTIATMDVTTFVDCQSRNFTNEQIWSYPINETDDYYFIFMSDNSLEENVMKYYLSLDRVTYNVSSSVKTCTNSTECSFPFKFLETDAVVIEMRGNEAMGNETLSELVSYELQVVCQPRVAVYMFFILLVPFIIMLFAFQ